ncbi:PAS domain-containing sensor histidine kinase [Pontibacter sp. JH31]|uniref:histidine kinase n=1 Tax=Pontibacter aquaedesilientis TaxID=2766980 RepID=A0ABR7XDI1_9BACT|nr:PAS domain-containing sensor histidine kinase [Pontibacter aquaedesilientis]MBD1396342.1 PAS domain-containing sensor histidine kinase [Pontibacter aquaedesilientis]
MKPTDFKFDLFFEMSPDLLCIAGYDGYFKKINAAVSDLLGYTMEELYARPINEFIHPDDKEITSAVRNELVKAKPLNNFENRYITKAGETVWLSWTSLPVESEGVIFAIAKNITHKKKLEAERNILLANLTKINQDLKQLNYTTSHDLRSPVNNLLSLFKLIDVSKIEDQKTIQLINYLKQTGDKLKQTLNNYVDILTEKHDINANLEEVSLSACLDEVLVSISALIKTSKTTIHTDFSKAHTLAFNKVNLESVLLNLITNSIKYARPSCPPDISVRSEVDEWGTSLVYTDNGQGFDLEKVKDKIFGLNQKFHSHSDSKGIGLYLVHNHVTSAGGKIQVESKVNEGTTFTITLPRKTNSERRDS